jgi:hypothetical protein
MALAPCFQTLYSACWVSDSVDGVELFQFHPSGAKSHVREGKKQTDAAGKNDDVPRRSAAATSYREYACTWLCGPSVLLGTSFFTVYLTTLSKLRVD